MNAGQDDTIQQNRLLETVRARSGLFAKQVQVSGCLVHHSRYSAVDLEPREEY